MKTRHLPAAAGALILAIVQTASAAPINGTWYSGGGDDTTPAPPVSATNSDTFTWGDAASPASRAILWSKFDEVNLEVGESAIFSFDVTPNDGDDFKQNNGFRVGLFHDNGSSLDSNLDGSNTSLDFNPWRGYFSTHSLGDGEATQSFRARVAERLDEITGEPIATNPTSTAPPQTGDFFLGASTAAGITTAGQTVSYEMVVTRVSPGVNELSVSLGDTLFNATDNFVPVAVFSSFNSVAFQVIGGQNYTNLTFSNVAVSVVPEPGTLSLGVLAVLCLSARRRK